MTQIEPLIMCGSKMKPESKPMHGCCPPGVTFDSAAIGRVIAVKRRCGLGSKIVAAAVNIAKEKFGADKITIEAQTYARRLYEKAGFHQTSEEFLEDGIPHIRMQLTL